MSCQVFICVLTILSTVTCQSWKTLFSTAPPPVTFEPPNNTTLQISEREGCGWRNSAGISNRITGNTESIFGEFPWVIAIHIYNIRTHQFQYCCVGSLIHPSVVLTANRLSLVPPSHFRVIAGDCDITGDYEVHKHQTGTVKVVIGHPDFKPATYSYDVSLMFLETPMTMAPNVGLACLTPHDTRPAPGSLCIVTGWGYETFDGTIQNIMKMVEVPIVEHSDCKARLRRAAHVPLVLDSTMICAGGELGKDSCLKDGGAPLICPYQDTPDRYYQVGVVSWGLTCGRAGVPGVYADVASLQPWIESTMRSMGFNSTSYTP